jgi:hypothetical protein
MEGSLKAMSKARLDFVAEAGRLLFGDRWMSDLARELGVAVRTMQAWYAAHGSSSYREMPASVLGEVRGLVEARQTAIGKWLETTSES